MIFKTMTNTSGKTGIQQNNFISGLFNGDLFKKQTFSLSEVLSTSDVDAIKAYNKQIDNCVTSQTAFNRTMLNTSKEAQNVVAAANGNKVALDGLTKSSKAAELGMKALAMAGNMLLIYALTSAVDIIYKCATASDRLAESAAQMSSEFVSTKSDISDYKTKIKELYQTINDDTSSYEDTYNARQELLKIQDEMIDKFGDEADAVKLVTDAINGQTDSLDTLTQDKWQETVNAFNSDRGKGWTEKVADAFANIGHGNNFQRMIDEMEDTEVTFHMIPMYGDDTYEEFSKKLKEDFGADITRTERDDAITLSGDLDTIYKQLLNIQTLAKGMGIDDTFLNDLGNQADEAKSKLDEYQEMYSQHVLYDKIFNSEDYEKSFDEINKAYEKYQDAFASGDEESIEKAKQNYAEIVQSATKGLDDQSVIDYFNSMYPDLQEVVGGWEFEVKFKAAVDDDSDDFEKGVQDAVNKFDTIEDIKNYNPKVATDEQKDAYLQLKQYADEYGLTLDQLIDKLVQLGLLQSQSKSDLLNKLIPSKSSPTAGVASVLTDTMDGVDADEATKWVESLTEEEAKLANSKDFENALEEQKKKLNGASLSADDYAAALQAVKDKQNENSEETPILSLSETITELDKVKEKMDVVDKTYAKLFDKDENIGFEDYSNIAEAFKDVSGIENYIDRLQKAGQNAESVKQVMSSLTGAYIEQSGILDKVNEQNAGLIEQTLTEMGVENSHELVLQRLSAAKEIAALKSFDLANATTADILKLVEEGKVSEETANYLLQYALKKELANGTTLTTDSDIENIKKLVLALGGAIDELNAFQNAKNGVLRQLKNPNKTKKHTGNTKIFDEGSYSTESQEKAQDEIDSVLTKQYNYSGGSATSKAVNDAAKAAKDAAKDVKEAVAETFDFIENGINRFDKAFSKLEDKVDKTSSSFTSRLNAYKEALNAATFGIELLTDDYNKYMQKANEVGLNEDIASAVRGGASNIWDYSDDTVKQQIKDYQNWYDKAQDCLDKIDELKDKQLELTQASIELLITQYEKLSTKVENANDRMEKWISLKESWGFSANTKNYDSMNKNIQKQIDYINKQDEQLKLLQKTVTKGSEAWYEYNERIDSNKASLIELKQQMQENATAAAALAKTTADKKTEKYDSQDELYDAKIDNATSAKSKNKLIDKKISNINKTQKAYNTAVSTDNKNLKSAKNTISKFKSTKENKKILASIKKAAKSGKRISQSLLNKAFKLNDNGKLYNACVQYNAYLDAKEADKATADLYKETAKQDKATLAKEKFDNISSDYENKISSNEQKKTSLNNKISLAQEQGKKVSAAYYKSLISAEKGEQSKLIKERKKLQKSLNDAVISGSIKKGSDEWFEMVSAINEVTNAIDESTQSIVEYQNALRQLKWDAFDKSLETVKRINSEADYYIDLLSHKDMTDKDTGNFTKYGTATIGLHKTNYDNYLAQADEYQREYNKIMRQIEKGELSLSDENVVQRLRDLQNAHREAKKSAEDELQSIQDLVKQGYEAQTDALSELIDKYKKLKDSELEAYKYQKEIAEKTKTIASLQKQLTAYNGNDSEESRAQIQKLKVQLEEAKSDLKDTQYEKFISDTEDMLDDLMNDYQKFIDEKLNDTNTILDEIKTLLGSDIIETIKGLDSNLTNDTKDQIGSSTTNGGDGGQAAKDYVHNTVTNDQNKVNSKTDTSSYDPAKEADIAKKKNGIAQKKKAINGQRQSFQNQIKELESQLKQLYGELNSIENKYQFEKSSTKNKDKLQDLKNNYIEKKSGLNAMIQDVTHNKDVLQQFIADLDKQSAQLDTDLVSLKGYEKGSKHIDKRQLAWTQENKRELIYRAADGALLTELNPEDKVFTNEMTENLWKMAQMNPAQMYAGQFTPVTPDFSKSVNNSSNIEVTFGDLVLPDVTNSAEFADSVESVMREAICKNGKTTQCITEAVSAKQLGKNRNSIGNARLYK